MTNIEDLQKLPIPELVRMLEICYESAKAKIAAGEADQELIRACNTARKQLIDTKKLIQGA